MIKKVLVILAMLLIVIAAGCVAKPKSDVEPTEVKVTRVVPDPTKPVVTAVATEAATEVAAEAATDSCVDCHTDKDLLVEIAVAVEVEEESEGVG